METWLIQFTHPRAHDLLKDLEALNIIKIIEPKPKRIPNSQRFRGKLSDKTAEALQKHIVQSRQEWN